MKYVKLTTRVIATWILVIGLMCVIKLYQQGKIHINNPNLNQYPIIGVDVSNHQGEIDWDVLADQGIGFAFIKSTEGSTYVDKHFYDNWENAYRTGLRIGAYHFFSFDSPGKTQAELFCSTVKQVDNMLPPVVDVEYYGKYQSKKDLDIPKIKKELRVLVDILEEHYGMKPIIYCGLLYDSVIKEDFKDCDLWYAQVYMPLFNKKDVDFWQYSNNHILQGYSGAEKFIDMNMFMGSKEEFDIYPNK